MFINFQEFLALNPNNYSTMLLAVVGFNMLHLGASVISMKGVENKQKTSFFRYLKLVVNYLFNINIKFYIGPTVGLLINIIYCNEATPYHQGQECYSPAYIPYCLIAGFQMVLLLGGTISYVFFFTIRNPFCSSPLAYPNRHHVISKSLLKILFPLYFALHPILNLGFLYVIVVPSALGLYLFFHRLNSLHSFDHKHFYV